ATRIILGIKPIISLLFLVIGCGLLLFIINNQSIAILFSIVFIFILAELFFLIGKFLSSGFFINAAFNVK
ncbi:hypothetical protein MRO80_07255, partial [Dickeya dianthicola]